MQKQIAAHDEAQMRGETTAQTGDNAPSTLCWLYVRVRASRLARERRRGRAAKKLLSALLGGQPSILFDNLKGTFKSSAMEAFFTAEHYTDRVLGSSKNAKLKTNALVLFSGNNFRPTGDLWRRILTARIDPKTEDAHRRTFDFNPLTLIKESFRDLVVAGLTMMRGFVAAGMPRITGAMTSGIRSCVNAFYGSASKELRRSPSRPWQPQRQEKRTLNE